MLDDFGGIAALGAGSLKLLSPLPEFLKPVCIRVLLHVPSKLAFWAPTEELSVKAYYVRQKV